MGNLVLFKGDDTNGTFGRHLQFTIDVAEGTSLTGCTASFTVQGITKSWTDIVSGQKVDLVYTHDETVNMKEGNCYGIFRITDASGNVRTFDDTIPFEVTSDLRKVYPGSSSVTATVGKLIVSPITENDSFDVQGNDLDFRKCIAKLWAGLGGKVLNNV